MLSMNNAIILFLLVTSIFFIVCIFAITSLLKERNRRLMLEEFALTTSVDSEAIIIKTLDSIIASTLEEYCSKNIEYNDNYRITKDSEMQITKIVAMNVIANMSKIMYNKLMIIYSKDMLPKIISDRVYMQVVVYLTEKLSELE